MQFSYDTTSEVRSQNHVQALLDRVTTINPKGTPMGKIRFEAFHH